MPLGDSQPEILTKYGAYVRSLAVQVRRQFGGKLDLDDLIAYGNIGLLEAADRFDTKFGANFLTFAHYRIKGAIYDGLRKMGTLKGPDLSRVYVGERTTTFLQNKADQEAGSNKTSVTADDDSREIAVAVESLAAIFAASLEGMENLQVRDESLGPDERLEQEQLKLLVRKAVDKLPENEQKLLIAYYYDGKTLQEAGDVIGQSKSWASRLHARAIERLKDFLAEERATRSDSKAGLKKKENAHDSSIQGAQVAQQVQQSSQKELSLQKVQNSKFDGVMAQKAQQAQAVSQTQQVSGAQKAGQVNANQKVTETEKADKARLDKANTLTDKAVEGAGKKQPTVLMKMVGDLEHGQSQMDKMIQLAVGGGGKKMNFQQLTALQMQVYQYSQEMDLTSKVVSKATDGLKDTLKTQV